MIKLKDIVEEIMEPERMGTVWKSEKDTPDAVINFTHDIIARLIPEVGSEWPNFIRIKRVVAGNEWMIVNKLSGVSVFYSPEEDEWHIYLPGYKNTRPLSKNDLGIVVKRWI